MKNENTEEFLKDLEELFDKHDASVAFVGNRIKWFIGNDTISESGNSSNRMTIKEKMNQENV